MKNNILITIALSIILSTAIAQQPLVDITFDTLDDATILVRVYIEDILVKKGIIHDNDSPYQVNFLSDHENEFQPSQHDELLFNIDSPDNIGGVLPIDACYNSNQEKLYFYGGRYVIVVDAITKSKIKSIEVSQTSDHSNAYFIKSYKTKNMIYDPIYDKIYCATFENKIIVIDCTTDEVIDIIDSPSIINHISSSISLAKDNNTLYWFINYIYDHQTVNSYLIRVNRDSHQVMWLRQFNSGIYNLQSKYSEDTIYVSIRNNPGQNNQILALNANNLQDIDQFGEIHSGVMIINPELKILYAHKRGTNYIYSYDLNTHIFLDEISIPFNIVINADINTTSYNHIYFTGHAGSQIRGLSIIECASAQAIAYHPIAGSLSLLYNDVLELVYFGGNNQIKAVDGRYHDQVIYSSTNEGSYSTGLLNSYNNSIISVNTLDGNATFFEPDLDFDEIVLLGANLELGCFNPIDEKFYFIQTNAGSQHSYLTIFNANTFEHIDEITIGSMLNQIIYNKYNNRVYISSSGERKIIPIDGASNNIIENDIIILPGVHRPQSIYISSNNKIFISSRTAIFIYDGDSHALINTINLQSRITAFEENTTDGLVYAIEYLNPLILVIDMVTNEIIDNISLPYVFSYGDTKLTYVSKGNQLYASRLNDDLVHIISGNSVIETLVIPQPNYLAYNNLEDKMYVRSFLNITVIQNNNIIKEIAPLPPSYGLIYNEINNQIYIHDLLCNNSVWVIDCTTDIIKGTVSLNQNQISALSTVGFHNSMVFDNKNNRLICGNRGFSNISVIQCATDILPLRKGWTWLSFPRLYRTKNNYVETIPVLEKIGCFPVDLNMHYLDPWQHWIEYIDDTWDGPLTEIRSSEGYKLEIIPSSDENLYIEMVGAKLHPNTGMTLLPNQENWIGYFLPNGQLPADAFPSYLYNDRLTQIKTQDWTMVKIQGEWVSFSKVRPFNYGDMIILTINGTTPVEFQWNNTGIDEEYEEYPETEYYEFDEQADYLPVYIETEPDSDIQEIAILADNEVKGAVVRLPGDTLVQLNAYIMDVPPGTPLEFETWSGYKSQRTGKGGYSVLNHQYRRYEQRILYSGENKPFQFVSLKTGQEAGTLPGIPELTCSPNPFSDIAVFSFTLGEETNLQFVIYDLLGKVVAIPASGTFAPGNYSITWNGECLHGKQSGNGVYIYRLTGSPGQDFSGKLVLIK